MSKCSLVKYNPTGHLIAVVSGDAEAKEVVIFSTLFHKQLAVLRGHYTPVGVGMCGVYIKPDSCLSVCNSVVSTGCMGGSMALRM